MRDLLHVLQPAEASPHSIPGSLSVGCGPPGTWGCTDGKGLTVQQNIIVGQEWSILTGMDKLGLHAIGLPAARLRDSFSQAPGLGITVYACGGPSFHSVAAFVRSEYAGTIIQRRYDVGRDACLWLDLALTGGVVVHWAVVQLPTPGDRAHEQRWHAELNGLQSDVAHLKSLPGSVERRFLLTGDFNVQPSTLSGAPDTRPARDRAILRFLSITGFILRNMPVAGKDRQRVFLPDRNRFAIIRPGDTHHCLGGGQSRVLDLVIASADLEAGIVLHNGIACKSGASECLWDNCCELTHGDHFWHAVSLGSRNEFSEGDVESTVPAVWHTQSRWLEGLKAVGGALTAAGDFLKDLVSTYEGAPVTLNEPWSQWAGDATVCILMSIE